MHRQAWQRRGAELGDGEELGSGEEQTGALMSSSLMVLLEVEQAACMKSQLSWAPLAKGCGVITRSYHEAINIRRRPPSTLSIISAGTQLSLTLNQLVTQLSLSPQLREQKKHTLHPVKNIAPLDARRCTLSWEGGAAWPQAHTCTHHSPGARRVTPPQPPQPPPST